MVTSSPVKLTMSKSTPTLLPDLLAYTRKDEEESRQLLLDAIEDKIVALEALKTDIIREGSDPELGLEFMEEFETSSLRELVVEYAAASHAREGVERTNNELKRLRREVEKRKENK